MASAAHVGDSVPLLRPPGLKITALAAGVPSAGLLVVPLPIFGFIQHGSLSLRAEGRGVAHIGDQIIVPMPPTLAITGSIVGTVTFVLPLQGVIETASKTVKANGRGIARTGDTVMAFFPPLLAFTGTVAGNPFTGPLQILTPLRGFIRSTSKLNVG